MITLLHRLWTKAASADGYDKSEWLSLEREITDQLGDLRAANTKLRNVLGIACEQLEAAGWAKPPVPGTARSNEWAALEAWRRLVTP